MNKQFKIIARAMLKVEKFGFTEQEIDSWIEDHGYEKIDEAEAAWNTVIDELIKMDWSKLHGAIFHKADESNHYNTILDTKVMLQQMKQEKQ